MQTYRIEGFDTHGRPRVEFISVYPPVPPLYFWLGRDADPWKEISGIERALSPAFVFKHKPLSYVLGAWMLG
jgi:hypothetical protein